MLALDLCTTRRGDWRFPTAGGFVWAGVSREEESPRQELQELCYARVVQPTRRATFSGWGCSDLKGDVSEILSQHSFSKSDLRD